MPRCLRACRRRYDLNTRLTTATHADALDAAADKLSCAGEDAPRLMLEVDDRAG